MRDLPQRNTSPRRAGARTLVAVASGFLLFALGLAWAFTPMASLFDPRALAGWQETVRGWRFAPLAVVTAYVVAGLVATPATLLIGATVVLFGASYGALYSYLGMFASGLVMYGIGRFAARELVDDWLTARAGSTLEAFNRQLARRGFVAVALARLTPVPFSLQSGLIGASRIGFPDFVAGTAIGIVPVIAAMAGFATRIDAWLEQPDWSRLIALIGLAVGIVVVWWLVRIVLHRRTAGRRPDDPPDA